MLETVFGDNFHRDIVKFEAKVLWLRERGHKVEIGDVHGHELGPIGGNNTVKQQFGHEHFSHGGGHFTGVIDSVTAHGEASAVGFCLFRAYFAYKVPICDVFATVVGNVGFADESNGVSALDAVAYTLGKVTKFVGGGDGPLSLIARVLQQLVIVEEFTRGFIKDRKSFVDFIFEL
jgi:hypothetical protein